MDSLILITSLMVLVTFMEIRNYSVIAKEAVNVGAIINNSSRIGKEERVAMEMAMEDFKQFGNGTTTLMLHVMDSHGVPFHAALAAENLINDREVKAILGLQRWEEASLVAEISSKTQTPILSFTDSAPKWAEQRWPYLLQVSPNKDAQMRAVVDIVQSWEWHRVTLIYEDVESSMNEIMPYLSETLNAQGVEISHVVAIPSFSSSMLTKELEKLKEGQCRVFIVHLSLELGMRFFERVKKMRMMEEDYIWIATDGFTSLIHSLNSSTIKSIQGLIGVKSYSPENEPRFHDFYKRFQRRFSAEHPEEENHEPGIYAIQAYDAMWAMALALNRSNDESEKLFSNILDSDFGGLIGNFAFINRKIASIHTFQIVNVIGKSYRELGFWVDGAGFTKTLGGNVSISLKEMGQVIWPGEPWTAPKGWTISASDKQLKIGVPTESIFKQYVSVEFDHLQNATDFKGYAVELFEKAITKLPFYLPYKFYPFTGKYDDLVKQIALKNFDAAIGDIAIIARRFQYAEFTHPYTESELVMVVPVQSKAGNKAWLFTRPFTRTMWFLICAINVYNGFVVWLIERNHCSELRGSVVNQMGVLLWLSFTTLFSLRGEKLHSNLSRMSMVVWLFVALIITQTYTANLSSILTVQGLEPTVDNIESLRSSNAVVGHFSITFVAKYMEDVLHFNSKNIKQYSVPEDCVKDLRNKAIAAVFLEKPIAKLFLARYCSGFVIAEPSFKVGGFGFAFPKGSPLLHHVTEALVDVSEQGMLQELERNMLSSEKCEDQQDSLGDDTSSLSPSSFWILFIFTGGASTIALLIHAFRRKNELVGSLLMHSSLWNFISSVLKHWNHQRKRLSRKVSVAADLPSESPNDSRVLDHNLAIITMP